MTTELLHAIPVCTIICKLFCFWNGSWICVYVALSTKVLLNAFDIMTSFNQRPWVMSPSHCSFILWIEKIGNTRINSWNSCLRGVRSVWISAYVTCVRYRSEWVITSFWKFGFFTEPIISHFSPLTAEKDHGFWNFHFLKKANFFSLYPVRFWALQIRKN